MPKHKPVPRRSLDKTELYTWFERDRAHVELRDSVTDETIIEWWDEAVAEAVEDGFLDPKNWKMSAYEDAVMHGLLLRPFRVVENDTYVASTGSVQHPRTVTLLAGDEEPVVRATGEDLDAMLEEQGLDPDDWRTALYRYAVDQGLIE